MTKGPKIKWIYYDQDSKVTLWEDITFNTNHMTVQKPKNIAKKVISPAFKENGSKDLFTKLSMMKNNYDFTRSDSRNPSGPFRLRKID